MPHVRRFVFSAFQTNTFVCDDEGEAVIVDASCVTNKDVETLVGYLNRKGLVVRHLLLTHGHIDHILGCTLLSRRYGLDWQMHRQTIPLVERSRGQSILFQMPAVEPPVPGRILNEGDTIEFGGCTLRVILTPGHAPGSICFHEKRAGIVFSGDVLFMDSIGRVDLPGGSLPVLMRSIFQSLMPLGDDTRVYPGHGPQTTIGRERMQNPFLNGSFPLY